MSARAPHARFEYPPSQQGDEKERQRRQGGSWDRMQAVGTLPMRAAESPPTIVVLRQAVVVQRGDGISADSVADDIHRDIFSCVLTSSC